MMIPMVQIAINMPSSFGLTAFLSIIIDGRLSVVTAIMKLRIVPNCAPFDNRASATGIVPKISAYIGMPTIVERITENGFEPPRISDTKFSGIQLWIVLKGRIRWRVSPSRT